jgi:signal transduction histidine kinase
MKGVLTRLRWQLTLSHLIAIAVTLISMIAAVLLIASTWWSQPNDTSLEPAIDARAVAEGIRGLVLDDSVQPPSDELSSVLALLARGDVRLLSGLPAAAPDAARFHAPIQSSLSNIAYLVVLSRDGHVLGSSDPSGAAFAPPERTEWSPLADAALSGSTDPSRLVSTRSGDGPVAVGAYPILDQNGEPAAVALVARSALAAANSSWDFWQALLFFGAATLAVLLAASIFALISSSVVSYLLARRLVRRLERLGQAAEAFAGGDLTLRVDAGITDEVGQLSRRFNVMADRLAETLAELETEKQTVESALQAKRELVANVSHELRTPLASIRGHTESLLLRGDGDRDQHRTYLNVIFRQSEQLSRLIDDLFLLSTTESGALPLTIRPVRLGEVVQEVISSIQPAARAERRVSLVVDVDPELPAALADRQRLGQVLANLVRNAVRHTAEGGLVAVRAGTRDERLAVVSVEDTGEGIAAEDLEHVFERFYRADPARDRASGGAGLGLAIVRELVSAMGGDVSAESVVGEGSRFSFTLPLEPYLKETASNGLRRDRQQPDQTNAFGTRRHQEPLPTSWTQQHGDNSVWELVPSGAQFQRCVAG